MHILYRQGCQGHQPHSASQAPRGLQSATELSRFRHGLNTALRCSRQQGCVGRQGSECSLSSWWQRWCGSSSGRFPRRWQLYSSWGIINFAAGEAAFGKCSHHRCCLLPSPPADRCVLQWTPKAGVCARRAPMLCLGGVLSGSVCQMSGC
jgi:hypothetical protein